jgi:hypothetical protein
MLTDHLPVGVEFAYSSYDQSTASLISIVLVDHVEGNVFIPLRIYDWS